MHMVPGDCIVQEANREATMTTMKAIAACSVLVCCLVGSRASASAAEQVLAVLEELEVRGGFIVVLGCGDATLLSRLGAEEGRVVQALGTDAAEVAAARAHVLRAGIYGRVSARVFDGRTLPYVDNLVNAVVISHRSSVTGAEFARVLAPRGVLLAPSSLITDHRSLIAEASGRKGWTGLVKPVPDAIDEWTHFLHGPGNNAVAQDTRIDVPRHMQWTAGPRWSRHHDRMASLSAAVSAKGRLFVIMDQGSRASPLLPADWRLMARDAFNGVLLWDRSIPDWYPHLWPLKSGPAWLPRRLVADGDFVYVTLGLHAEASQLDAVTGKTVQTYSATKGTSEILFDDGLLLVTVDASPPRTEYALGDAGFGTQAAGRERDLAAKNSPWDWTPKRIVALRAHSGDVLWERRAPVAPLTLALNAQRVVFHDGEGIVCLGRAGGKELWKTRPDAGLQGSPRNWYDKTIKHIGKLGKALPSSFAPTLVLHEDVVLFSGGDGKLCGLDLATGKQLWVGECLASGHYSPEDVLVAGGLVWTADTAFSKSSGKMVGLDPRTGAVKRTVRCDAKIHWFHQRCYRAKATERFLLPSRNGIEFVDHEAGTWQPNHWVRGGCLYGILPCNGLVYAPPHNCACYLEAKVYGFTALAGARAGEMPEDAGDEPTGRLLEGPAFSSHATTSPSPSHSTLVLAPSPDPPLPGKPGHDATSWPVFRHDNARSGRASCRLSETLAEAWRVDLGSRATQATASGGRVCVAVPELHQVVCLRADTGEELWRFAANARVDSPPALVPEHDLCVFGSADGSVYCLSLSNGKLVWRFRAAPTDRALVSFDQPESVWPVSGSVLVRDGTVTFVAGRSAFLDGGLRMIRLNLRTGKLLAEQVMDDRDPERPERQFQYRLKGLNMPVGLPDILSCDGKHMYMRSQRFDLAGKRLHLDPAPSSPRKNPDGAHLFSPTGFLDDTWMHRSYWVYGVGFDEGAGAWPRAGKTVPAGRILCFDEDSVYGYGRKPKYFTWSTPLEYHLFAARKPGQGGVRHRWSRPVPLHVRAIIAAEGRLFIAGPRALLHEPTASRRALAADTRKQFREQAAALQGRRGGLLQVVSADDGRTLTELKTDFLPAFDGMSAAAGRLFIASHNGRLICY